MWTPIGLIQQLKPYPGGHGEGVTITEWRRKAYQHLSRVTNLGRNYLCKETHEWSAINNARTSIEQYISMSLSYLINQLFFWQHLINQLCWVSRLQITIASISGARTKKYVCPVARLVGAGRDASKLAARDCSDCRASATWDKYPKALADTDTGWMPGWMQHQRQCSHNKPSSILNFDEWLNQTKRSSSCSYVTLWGSERVL